MPKDNLVPAQATGHPHHSKVVEILMDLVTRTPESDEEPSQIPLDRAQRLKRTACLKAATISGALALPPGPLGMATILPDLVAIWRLQQQMVADIASSFGKRAALTREIMIYCLFRHGAAFLARDLVVRMGERLLVRRIALRSLQQVLHKIGLRITQKTIGKTLSRYIPLVGTVGVAGYAYYDTKSVAETAIELFSRPLDFDENPSLTPP